jgi:hypothetical protein
MLVEEGNYRLFHDCDVLESDATLNVVDGGRLLCLLRHYCPVHHSYRSEFKFPFHSQKRGAGVIYLWKGGGGVSSWSVLVRGVEISKSHFTSGEVIQD